MLAIGLMSGTSLDGVDASLIETDGENHVKYICDLHLPYPLEFQEILKRILETRTDWFLPERVLTDYHIEAAEKLLQKAGIKAKEVRALGFHGQTIYHEPARGITWQIGNPHYLAAKTGIDVVSDFRRRDVAGGGQGAPLIPVFHRSLMSGRPLPVAVLNIGGVANITYIGEHDLIAFDTGPGNALINDAMMRHYGKPYDDQGKIAARGQVEQKVIEKILALPYFAAPVPKSLDRNEFASRFSEDMPPDNLIATLTALTVKAIKLAFLSLPKAPNKLYVCGGGTKNLTMMKLLKEEIGESVIAGIASIGINPDFVESQGFGYLAVRYLKGLASTLPTTTGVSQETLSGVLFPA